MQDMYSRRRAGYRGRDVQRHAKVTEAQAVEIVARYVAGGVSQQRLAEEYGCDQTTISDIVIKARKRGIMDPPVT